LEELAVDLSATEPKPLAPLLRKGIRLAALVGEVEYQELLDVHLGGLLKNAKPYPHRRLTKAQEDNVLRALWADRHADENVMRGEGTEQLEWLAAELSKSLAEHLEEVSLLRDVVERIRNRLARFLVIAEATLNKHDIQPKAHAVSVEPRILIGHGRAASWKDLSLFLTTRLGLKWEEFNRESPAGLSTTTRLEQMLNACCFGLLVLTAEDQHQDGTTHARENVIHELGLCQGRFGPQRAIALVEEGCSEFSNIVGLNQIRFPAGQIEVTWDQVRQVLERENLVTGPTRGSAGAP